MKVGTATIVGGSCSSEILVGVGVGDEILVSVVEEEEPPVGEAMNADPPMIPSLAVENCEIEKDTLPPFALFASAVVLEVLALSVAVGVGVARVRV